MLSKILPVSRLSLNNPLPNYVDQNPRKAKLCRCVNDLMREIFASSRPLKKLGTLRSATWFICYQFTTSDTAKISSFTAGFQQFFLRRAISFLEPLEHLLISTLASISHLDVTICQADILGLLFKTSSCTSSGSQSGIRQKLSTYTLQMY